MNKKSLLVPICIIFLLGIFFQMNRMDTLLHIFKNENTATKTITVVEKPDGIDSLKKDNFLIIYDDMNVYSTFLKYRVQKQLQDYLKKQVDIVALNNTNSFDMGKNYSAVLWLAPNFNNAVLWENVKQYTVSGGTLMILMGSGFLNNSSAQQFAGIASAGSNITVNGVNITSDFLLGAKNFNTDASIGYSTYALDCNLQPDAEIYFRGVSQLVPLAWSKNQGKGKCIVYNGVQLYAKRNIGILTALLSQSHDDFLFPVSATQTMFIDDFPSPIPQGTYDKIYNEYHLTTKDFYEQVWWPYMLETAKRFNLKYTGAIIETYNAQVNGDFYLKDDNARRNFIKYGRELVNSGGELGIHGYNHQSLAGAGYGVREYLGYNIWTSQTDMEHSLQELKRYITNAFPGYAFQAYVAPSNVVSPEGKAAVKNVFPNIKSYSALYSGDNSAEKADYQDFKRDDNGIYEFPRVTSGYNPDLTMYFDAINVLNGYGIISHFVHPDEIFYDEPGHDKFSNMEKGFTSFVKYFHEHYPWVRPATLSNTLKYFDDYLNMDYRYTNENNILTIYTWNYRYKPAYILRSTKPIERYEGCDIEKLQDNAYCIKINSSKAVVTFKESKI